MKNYIRLGAMIASSMVAMYAFTYLNTYEFAHVFFSETRLYMTVMMGASMAVIMLVFMLHMLTNKKLNIIIVACSIIVFSLSLFAMRSQILVDDVSYMRAMIPHHSIAILTSERAGITDPRVRDLADSIIEAQKREIQEMKMLIEDLK